MSINLIGDAVKAWGTSLAAFLLPATTYTLINVYVLLPFLGPYVGLSTIADDMMFFISVALLPCVSFTLYVFNTSLIRFFEGYAISKLSLGKMLRRSQLIRREKTAEIHLSHSEDSLSQDYPTDPICVLPTRFGNVIAAFEEYPHRRYGIDTITMWPRLVHLLKETDYYSAIGEAKATVDFLLNTCIVTILLGSEFIILGLWLGRFLIAGFSFLFTLLLAAIFYSGMIPAARKWGVAICVGFDLYHGDLYKRLKWRQPPVVSNVRERKEALNHNLKGKIDFGIITVREDEFQAVLRRFPRETKFTGRRRYTISRIPLDGSDYYLAAIVRCPEQGNSEAQTVAHDLIVDLDPQWLVLIGIAGGVPHDDFTLGDVVAAMRLHDFSIEAALERRASEYDNRGAPMKKVVQVLLADLGAMEEELKGWNSDKSVGMPRPTVQLEESNYYGDDEWKRKVKEKMTKHFGPSATRKQPKVTTAAIASSDRLVKDSKTIQTWQSTARHLQAVEMELAGIYQASRQFDPEYPILAIRGISDIVGFDREDDWTTYACHSSAAFARALLSQRIIEPRSAQASS